MRILHLADTHLGAWLRAHGAPEGWSRADEHARAMERALAPALEGEVDLVLHGGDLFDGRKPARAVVEQARALLERVAAVVPVVVVPGNHDPRVLRRVMPLPPPGLHLADEPCRLRFGDLTVAAVPFRRTEEGFARAAAEAVGPGTDLLLTHQAVDGCAVPGFVFRVGRPAGTMGVAHVPPGVRWLLGGHLHPRQVVQLGEATMVYPGATQRTAASEGASPKGYALWELGRTVRWRFVDLPDRTYTVLRGPEGLEALRPEQLVHVANGPDRRELFHAARARGAWVVGRGASETPRPRLDRDAQQRLFGR